MRVDLEMKKLSKNVDAYVCTIHAKNQFFNSGKTVGHIPREIFCHIFYFIKTRGGFVNGSVISTNITHHLFHLVDWKFCCCLSFRAWNRRRLKKLKTLLIPFMTMITVELMIKKAMIKKTAIFIETVQSKSVSHTQTDQSDFFIYTDRSSEQEEDDLNVDISFDEPTWTRAWTVCIFKGGFQLKELNFRTR